MQAADKELGRQIFRWIPGLSSDRFFHSGQTDISKDNLDKITDMEITYGQNLAFSYLVSFLLPSVALWYSILIVWHLDNG